MENQEIKYPIKNYSKKEMMAMYGVGRHVFVNFIERAGLMNDIPNYKELRNFTPKEVSLIFDRLGEP